MIKQEGIVNLRKTKTNKFIRGTNVPNCSALYGSELVYWRIGQKLGEWLQLSRVTMIFYNISSSLKAIA